MEEREKIIMDEVKEENRLLKLKIDAYKEELKSVSDKFDYSQKFVLLYESIIDASREEIKGLSNTVKRLEKELLNSSKKANTKKATIKKQASGNVKKQAKTNVKQQLKKTSKKAALKNTKKTKK